jgi:predicted O-methyltransferase YrrM
MMFAKSLQSKLETLRWYAARPSLYREMVRKLVRRQFSTTASKLRGEQDKREGQAWCLTVLAQEAQLYEALSMPIHSSPVSELHAMEWSEATKTVAACPVKMGGPADVAVLYHLVRHLPARRVLETGVASGWSSLAILLAMREAGQGRLISIDMPYAKLNNENYVGCAVPESLRGSWKLIRRSDRDALDPAINELGEIDLAHYDSDKSYTGRMFAYPRLWAALREGALLMSDDVEDNLAFRDFAQSVQRKAWVFEKKPGNYAGVLIK